MRRHIALLSVLALAAPAPAFAQCLGDRDVNQMVNVNELVCAVNNALIGCAEQLTSCRPMDTSLIPRDMPFNLMWDLAGLPRYATVLPDGSARDSNEPGLLVRKMAGTGVYCINAPRLTNIVASLQNNTGGSAFDGDALAHALNIEPGHPDCGSLGARVSTYQGRRTLTSRDRDFSLILGSGDRISRLVVRAGGGIISSDIAGVTITRIGTGHYCIKVPASSAVASLHQGGETPGIIRATTSYGNECNHVEWDVAVEIGE